MTDIPLKGCFVFGKDRRVQTAAEFRVLLSTPIRSRTRYLGLYHGDEHNATQLSRLGLVVAKRYAKRSVERNRIKRVVREFFRIFSHTEQLAPLDYVVRLRNSFDTGVVTSASAQKKILLEELENLFLQYVKSSLIHKNNIQHDIC